MPHAAGHMLRIDIPVPSVVVLIGASGAGKSSLARALFKQTEILSSDRFRAFISDNENDQAATADAFQLLYLVARKRLRRKRLCVIDATNIRERDRAGYVTLAREFDCPAVAIVLDPGIDICIERTTARRDRDILPEIVRQQYAELRRSLHSLNHEGYSRIWLLRDSLPGAVTVFRQTASVQAHTSPTGETV
ncbi:MAG TPA: AAA family ATPase [Bryobacteraceae bacterium]|nr:AAA family ATPase [Bryobacteraceae bacterium]